MTIAPKLQLTLDTKAAIKSALIAKGAEPTDVFSTYPALIESLATAGIATPQIIAPMDGAGQVSQQPIITATLYFSADPDDGHAASTWEFASDSGFANILHTSGRDTINLESYDLSAAGYSFPQDTRVYCRVTYESQSGVEQASPVIFFTAGIVAGAVIDGDIVVAQSGGFWLLAAPAAKRARLPWGLSGTDTILTNVTSSATPDADSGEYNTSVLVSSQYNAVTGEGQTTGSPAAQHCYEMGYALPNKEDLDLLFINKSLIDSVDASGGEGTLSAIGNQAVPFSDGYILSSTEYDSDNAWNQRFSDGLKSGSGAKSSYGKWIAPVRYIPV